MLSREAVRKLNDLVDVATDEPDGHINIDEIKNCWQLKGFFDDLVRVVSAGHYCYLNKRIDVLITVTSLSYKHHCLSCVNV